MLRIRSLDALDYKNFLFFLLNPVIRENLLDVMPYLQVTINMRLRKKLIK